MPEAPESHRIGREARKLFESLLPSAWLPRKHDGDDDYGVDYTVEIVEGTKVTGQSVFVQLKGTLKAKERANSVVFSLEVDRVKYLNDHQLPAFLVVVDVPKRKLFWVEVHQFVRDILDVNNPSWRDQATVTLSCRRMDDENRIESEWARIAREGPREITISKDGLPEWDQFDRLRGLSTKDFEKSREDHAAIAELSAGSNLQKALHLLRDGKNEEGWKYLARSWEEANESGDWARVAATSKAIVVTSNPADMEQNRDLFGVAAQGEKAAREAGLQREALHLRGLTLQIVAYKVINTANNLRLLLEQGGKDALTAFPLRLQLDAKIQALARVIQDYYAVLSDCLKNGHVVALVDLLRGLALVEIHLYKTTAIFEPEEKMIDLKERCLTNIRAASDLAERLGDSEILIDVLIHRAMVERGLVSLDAAQETLAQAETLAERLGDATWKASVARKKAALPQLYAPPTTPNPDDVSEEEKDAFFDHMVRNVAGANPDDPEDEIGQILGQGLRDRNPERVLRYCEYLHFAPVTWGEPARLTGLYTAGSKMLYCEKMDLAEEGYKLDEIAERFRDGHCVACPHRTPRRDWTWTEKWQRERGMPEKMRAHIGAIRGIGRRQKT